MPLEDGDAPAAGDRGNQEAVAVIVRLPGSKQASCRMLVQEGQADQCNGHD